MKLVKTLDTIVVLANAADLVCNIASEVVGNEVADTIQGNELSREALNALVMSKLQTKLNTFRGGI